MNLIVVAWAALSLVAFGVSVAGFADAHRDLAALRGIAPRNGRYLVARHALVRQAIRAAMAVAMLSIAFDQGALFVLVIFALNVGLSLSAWSDLFVGSYLRRHDPEGIEP